MLLAYADLRGHVDSHAPHHCLEPCLDSWLCCRWEPYWCLWPRLPRKLMQIFIICAIYHLKSYVWVMLPPRIILMSVVHAATEGYFWIHELSATNSQVDVYCPCYHPKPVDIMVCANTWSHVDVLGLDFLHGTLLVSVTCTVTGYHAEVHDACWRQRSSGCPWWFLLSLDTM